MQVKNFSEEQNKSIMVSAGEPSPPEVNPKGGESAVDRIVFNFDLNKSILSCNMPWSWIWEKISERSSKTAVVAAAAMGFLGYYILESSLARTIKIR